MHCQHALFKKIQRNVQHQSNDKPDQKRTHQIQQPQGRARYVGYVPHTKKNQNTGSYNAYDPFRQLSPFCLIV